MVPLRKFGLFGMYIYHRILVSLFSNKFHPTDITDLKIAPRIVTDYFQQKAQS